jgi:hypothetical protein
MKNGRYAEMQTRRSRRHEDHEEDAIVVRLCELSAFCVDRRLLRFCQEWRASCLRIDHRSSLSAVANSCRRSPSPASPVRPRSTWSRSSISSESLRQASAILGETFTADRLTVIQAALQRNLEQFQIVRDLVIDDSVEPAPVFDPRRR